ncbi:demethoxyubiquinone hydroxylase family protein [Bauldia sp.]|uniref:demethoxyubiquinone hydroxylase family protein n=1 Tax=Bauldia sp. TaxID=2575872 RepID=UPI003BAB1F96
MIDPETRDGLTVKRILKVNHAGEHGAIRIYRAQIAVARRLWKDVVPFLEETLSHEVKHCAAFREAMSSRGARPCRIMALWGNGGYVLGFFTAIMGRQGIWICTAEVESAVHRHMSDQLHFLSGRDTELRDMILGIQDEELSHLNHAAERITMSGWWPKALGWFIFRATDAVIWLSTWGDSVRMARELRQARS